MIKLFGRMVPMLMRARRGPVVPATETLSTRFRVLPHDIDLNGHLNNGRYLQLVDVNRAEWLVRTGIWDVVRRNRWRPVLGSTAVQFRRELQLWDTASIQTRLLGWDQRWTYLEHRVTSSSGRPMALALAKAGFRSQGQWISPEALRAQLPYRLDPMVLPAHALAWLALDTALDSGHQPQLQALG